MHARTLGMAALLLVLRVPPATAAAGPIDTIFAEYDTRLHGELRAIDPAAEELLRQADEARGRDDHRAAADLYAKVFEKVPTFASALRRQSWEEFRLGNRNAAITLGERAVATEKSADNLASLAGLLVTTMPGSAVSSVEVARADDLTREALAEAPADPYVLIVRVEVSLARRDPHELDRSVEQLARVAPDDKTTHYFRAIAAASHGKFDVARESLERAHAAGLPDESYRPLRDSLEKSRPRSPRLAVWVGITAGVWLAGALVLLAAGAVLSAITLRASERVPDQPEAGASGIDAFLRRLYRVVLWACCAYYYVSMPILFALVLAIGGGLLYEMLVFGHIPIKLLVIVLVITLATAWSIVRSLFVRRRDDDPGVRLDLDQHPALRRILVDVAARVGTRPVDSVYMTPGTEVAVFERGGLLRQLRGRTERCLILGAGALDDLSLGPFKAVLAHEYGHFSNRDTAGGGFALAVRMSVVALAQNLAKSGAAAWYNPAWLFVNGFHRLFMRISQGASRLQEVLADRWAAILYGAQAFEDGLRHVIARSVRFDAHVRATLNEVVDAKRPLSNLYSYVPAAPADAAKLDAAIQKAIERQPSPYDSHPRPADRFRWVHALGIRAEGSPEDASPVWGLFSDRTSIEERMTGVVRVAVAVNHGIDIAATP